MKLETIKQRIENAEQKIQKKQNTIIKKRGWIEKKTAKLDTLEDRERQWAEWDIKNLQSDITRLEKEIKEVESSIDKYNEQLTSEIAKEEVFVKEIPELLKDMQNELVDRWDEYDRQRRETVKKRYSELGYREFYKMHTHADYLLMSKSDAQIHRENVDAAKYLILDLYYRVKNITGEIIDWSGIHANQGTQGMTVLNGFVVGKEGRCRVESILAGGYNIQRLHVRVLVHEVN